MKQATSYLYPVFLSDEQRQRLTDVTRHGSAPVRKVRRAQVLLWSDRHREGGRLSRTEIGQRLGMHVNTVDRIRKAFVLDGEVPAIQRKARLTGPTPPRLDGRGEAQLVAICCSPPPEGRTRWTLTLLAHELKARSIVTSICAETVRQMLKKTSCSPGGRRPGASPNATPPASWPKWNRSWMSTPPRPTPINR